MKRLVAYIRQSLNDPSSSSPERQLEVIENWAKGRGVVISHIYQDIGGRRSESENVKTRKDFQKLLKDADAQCFDIIVVASQERFGTSDVYEFFGYLDRFNKLGIELWDAGKNLLLNPHGTEAAGILQSTIGTIIDTGEQMTRSRNTITGQSTKARKGYYLGGIIAYGVAIKCVTSDGATRWTSEMVGTKLYQTNYADGRVTVEPFTPTGAKAPSDKLLFCRSLHNDRILAVQHIFRSFLSGFGANKIAGDLNSLGYRLPGGRVFYSTFIRNILENGHIYTGRVAFYRASKAKFYQGSREAPVPVKNLKGKTKTKHNIDDWLISEEIFEPIISMEEYHRARDLLVSKARPRVRQNPKAVYAGLLICNCGAPMTACGTTSGTTYRCTTYTNSGGVNSPCTSNTVKETVIDVHVNKWLEEIGTILVWTDEDAPVTNLYKVKNINEAHRLLIRTIELYLSDKLSQVFTYEEQSDGSRVFEIPGTEIEETIEGTSIYDVNHRFRLPGYTGDPIILQNLLGAVESSVNANAISSMALLEARRRHILSIFPEALNKGLRDSLVKELNSLDSQIELARTGVTDYAKQHNELLVQLHEIYQSARLARTTKAPQARRKALLKLITEIRCNFVKSIWGRRVVYRLSEITIIPEVGDQYVCSPSTGACSAPTRSMGFFGCSSSG